MNKLKITSFCLAAMAIASCTKAVKTTGEKSENHTPVFQIENCDVKMGGLHFTKMANNADKSVKETNGIIHFDAPEGTDLFIDPNDGKLSQGTAKILLTEIDNSQPFTFSAKLKPGFTPDGLYNAADLVVVANDTLWQKFCFEQDERGKHRVVTVRTVGTSDDNNHQEISQDYIYYKISSDTRTIASYYSLDGKEWQMVRLYKNNYPKTLYVGICSQAPQKGNCKSEFSNVMLSTDNVGDFRLGQ